MQQTTTFVLLYVNGNAKRFAFDVKWYAERNAKIRPYTVRKVKMKQYAVPKGGASPSKVEKYGQDVHVCIITSLYRHVNQNHSLKILFVLRFMRDQIVQWANTFQ